MARKTNRSKFTRTETSTLAHDYVCFWAKLWSAFPDFVNAHMPPTLINKTISTPCKSRGDGDERAFGWKTFGAFPSSIGIFDGGDTNTFLRFWRIAEYNIKAGWKIVSDENSVYGWNFLWFWIIFVFWDKVVWIISWVILQI